ncbi:MAG TPA: ATP-binding cassette domain-containing protein [Desulfobulbus sp.]|nr:ATP-binding cassette domain-containing protein [Desulfobulbus sp.]
MNNHEYAIKAEALLHRYSKSSRPALNGCSLTVRKGEFYGLLGPNGAGKTTIIALLSGLFPPKGGKIVILGMDLRQHAGIIKGSIGLVPQDIALYDNLTARENLAFFGKLYGLGGRQLQNLIADCIHIAALREHADHRVATFSGGMKRRLNLAAGLINTPKILFLDEPTVGIDAQSRNLIHKQLLQLNQNGTTILYTTHYMEEAGKLCSRVGIIDSGQLLTEGTPGQLLEQNGAPDLEALFLLLTGKQLRDT